MASKYDIVVPTLGKVAPLKDLFLFDLENLHFLIGKSKTIWGTGTYIRALLVPSIVAMMILVMGILSPYGGFSFDFLIALGVLGIGGGLCWFTYRKQLLSKEGKLIQGRIIETHEHSKRLGPRWLDIYGWQFGATCAFRTPEGQVISNQRYAIRNDLINKVIMDGTPIVVLYRNPHHYKVLSKQPCSQPYFR
jgi:hypothetical protein